jgi:hypothetical protein
VAKRNLWEIHHDPYDVTRIWVRNHHTSGWIIVPWRHLSTVPVPFGELAWDHARRGLPDGTEREVAEAVADLLTRAHQGPEPSPATAPPAGRDRRVAARTRAGTPAVPASPPPPRPDPGEDDDEATPIAPVIPLGVFDAHEEAKKRW